MATKLAIGIDIGGTKIEGALVDTSGKAFFTTRIQTPINYKETFLVLSELIRSLLPKNKKIFGVGMSIPGSIDPKTKVLRNATNSPAINGTRFFADFTKKAPWPIRIENDANCLILSETRFGAAKGARHAVGLILGTGFGSGVLVDGKILKGSSGLATELGHTILDVAGRLCLCGNRGCVEAYLSGPSILRRYHEDGGDIMITKTEGVFKNAKSDLIAASIVSSTKYLFSRFVSSLISVYDPEVIVLGGGLSKQKMYYGCADEIKKYVFGARKVPKIIPAKLGDASGKIGAAGLFMGSRLDTGQ